jgi:hypothetical protein
MNVTSSGRHNNLCLCEIVPTESMSKEKVTNYSNVVGCKKLLIREMVFEDGIDFSDLSRV